MVGHRIYYARPARLRQKVMSATKGYVATKNYVATKGYSTDLRISLKIHSTDKGLFYGQRIILRVCDEELCLRQKVHVTLQYNYLCSESRI